MEKEGKKSKHIRVYEPILFVIDEYAKKTQRIKSVVYEMALRSFVEDKKDRLIEMGISEEQISKAIDSGEV